MIVVNRSPSRIYAGTAVLLEKLGILGHSYHCPLNLRLHGPLNVGALQRSLNEIIRRHEILRTVVRGIDGEPVQVLLLRKS